MSIALGAVDNKEAHNFETWSRRTPSEDGEREDTEDEPNYGKELKLSTLCPH